MTQIRLIKSSFYDEAETKKALAEFILGAEIFSMGEQCRAFEAAFAAKQERRHAVYVANGSAANLLLIQSLLNSGRLRRGDRVGISALTWSTNVMPLIQLGLVPVAIDCSLDTLNVSPETLEERIGGLSALFITNVLGFSGDLPAIRRLCDERGVLLLEDNCESMGSETAGIKLGNFGAASTFSFFIGHHMSTIEGGMICTDDDGLHKRLLIARAHGWDRNLDPTTRDSLRTVYSVDEFYAKYTFYDLALNVRPTEIGGFIGVRQMPFYDEIVARREANFRRFNAALESNDDFLRYDLSHMTVVSNFAFPVICRTPELAAHYREKFGRVAEIRPIIAGNITKQPFFAKYVRDIPACPNADFVHENGFYFGNNPEMTDAEIDLLCEMLETR